MINRADLHHTTASILEEAGWSQDRRISTATWRDALTKDGYMWFDSAEEFLANLGGLVIPAAKNEEAVFGSGTLITDPLLALGEYERIEQREVLLSEQLCPIGEWSDESVVLISRGGLVYAETTYQVLLLGRNPIDAIDLIIRAHQYPDIIEGTAWWLERE